MYKTDPIGFSFFDNADLSGHFYERIFRTEQFACTTTMTEFRKYQHLAFYDCDGAEFANIRANAASCALFFNDLWY